MSNKVAVKAYDFTLTALGSYNLRVKASYARLLAVTGNVEVSLDDGGFFPLELGQGYKDRAGDGWNYITIRDTSGAANTGTILLASGELVDQRIEGEVSVIDQSSSITRANQSFTAALSPASVGGQYAFGQLYNNTAGKQLEVRKIIIATTANSRAFVLFDTALLAGSVAVTNKLYGGSALTGRMASANNAAVPGTAGASVLTVDLTGGVPIVVDFPEPVILPNGVGLTGYMNVLGQSLTINYHGREVNA